MSQFAQVSEHMSFRCSFGYALREWWRLRSACNHLQILGRKFAANGVSFPLQTKSRGEHLRGQALGGEHSLLRRAPLWAEEVVVQMGLGATSCQWGTAVSLPTV